MSSDSKPSLLAPRRIVVKLGTGVLTDSRKQPDPAQLEQLVAQLAGQRKAGREIVLVTSGAVGAGMGALGYERRPGGATGSGQDTDNNQSDFRLISPSDPQSAHSSCLGGGGTTNPSGTGAVV